MQCCSIKDPYSIGGEVVWHVDQFCHTILCQQLLVGDVAVIPPSG